MTISKPTDAYVSPSATSLEGVNDTSDDESDHNSDDTILEGLKNTDFTRLSEAHCFILNQNNQRKSFSQREPINTPDDTGDKISLENVTCCRWAKPVAFIELTCQSARIVKSTKFNKHLNEYYPEPGEQKYLKVNVKGNYVKVSKPIPIANLMKSIKNSEAMLKSHIHIVTVLTMLTAGADNADTDEPLTLKQAMASPHWPEFKKAMQTEYDSLVHNNTWELVPTPTNQRVLTGRWVFKIKKDRFGNILKFKARWVAHGYKQEEGLDFTDTFASVVKPMFWKAMMAVAAKRGLKIWQMDVVMAYLFGFLDEKVYIRQSMLMKDSTMRVCLLKKALYSLKQSARVW